MIRKVIDLRLGLEMPQGTPEQVKYWTMYAYNTYRKQLGR